MDKLMIAVHEFVHVAGALVVVIAVVSILTGFMREFISQEKLQKRLTKHEKWGPLMGAMFGMLTPFCSASVVPVTMGMAEMGVSLGTVMSFLISAPLCNFIVLAMVYTAFGLQITLCYLVITFIAAIIGGWFITKTPWRNEIKRGCELNAKKPAPCCAATSSCGSTPKPKEKSACGAPPSCGETSVAEPTKARLAMCFALALFKKIIPYVLIGALISGVSAAYLSSEIVEKYVGGDNILSIIVSAVIGVPVYLRIEMAIPLLKTLILKGMGLGPAIALIVGGTGASLPEIALVSSVLKPKAVVAFVAIIVTTAIVGGVIIQALF